MKKSFKKFFSLFAIMTMVLVDLSSATVYASAKVNTYTYNELKNNILLIEQKLHKDGTNVEEGVLNFIETLEQEKAKNNNAEEVIKLQNLINTLNDLLLDYRKFENQVSNNNYIITATPEEEEAYNAAITATLAWFYLNGFVLAGELLAYARDNDILGSTYRPYFGTNVIASPVYHQIVNSPYTNGSDSFPSSGITAQQDLYYAIHSFYWKKETIPDRRLIIHDTYDFEPSKYQGIQDIAVDIMYAAQVAGVLTPYLVEIVIYY